MRLRILLPKVNPEAITVPTRCASTGWSGRKVHLRKARSETAARYGVAAGAGASLAVFEVQTHLSGLSPGDDPCADLATRHRAGRAALSAGVKLWGHLLSVRSPWGVLVQESHL